MKKIFPLILAALFIFLLVSVGSLSKKQLSPRGEGQKYLGDKKGTRWIDSQVDELGLRDRPIVKQDSYSTHFLREDGKITALFTAFKQNFEVSPGNWEPIDYSLEKSDDSKYHFKTKNGVGIYLSQNGQILNKEKGHEVGAPKMGWYDPEKDFFTQIDNLDKPDSEIKDNQLIVQGDGVRLVVYAYDTGAREDLIIENKNILKNGRPWEELVLKAEVSAEDNVEINGKSPLKTQELTEKDVLIINSEKGKIALPFPQSWDLKDIKGPVRRFLKKEDSRWLLYTTLAKSWLDDESRDYPVTIDPTYSSQPDGTSGIDNYMLDTSATTNNGTSTQVVAGIATTKYRTLIKFDLSSIPSGSTADSATLSLWLSANGNTTANTQSVYRVKRMWSETQSTWNVWNTGNSWTTAGGFDSTDTEQSAIASRTASLNEANGEKQWTNFNLDLLDDMFPGGSFTNNGFMIRTDEAAGVRNYSSSDFATAANRPKLVIVYTSNVPTAPTIGTPTVLDPTATGGTITDSGGYRYHTFTSDGTFTPAVSLNADYLVVGGGGGGGGSSTSQNGGGGGGGGGGYLSGLTAVTAQAYSVTIGAGGSAGAATSTGDGGNGGSTSLGSITAIGGGGGGAYANRNGINWGGSGGGGSAQTAIGGLAGTGGSAGGSGSTATGNPSGGGGGASAAGSNGTASQGGNGGNGSTWLNGSTYAGGGGGSVSTGTTGSGGTGGGGAGAVVAGGAGNTGTANTGGGGGGSRGSGAAQLGGAGGTGIVIVRYPLQSFIRWTFTDNASSEDGFKVYDDLNNLVATCAATNLTFCEETGLSANTQYTRKVVAYNGAGNSSYSSTATIYSPANAPGTPTVSSSGSTTANVIVAVNSNPASTEFAIQETGSGNYVNKTTGALQGSASWGTYADFGSASGITVTGLSVNTQYTFKVKARNGDNAETSFGSTASAYTRATAPPAPTVSLRTTPNQQGVTPSAGTNPSSTKLAIYKEVGTTCDGSGGTYVAADGTDNGATAIWQTAASWGTISVKDLSAGSNYAFCVVARNEELVASSFGSAGAYNSCIPGYSGDHTITQDCSFPSFTDGNNGSRIAGGVDHGTLTTNDAVLTIQSGILTVNSNETIAAGSFVLTGGSIVISTGGELKVGSPIWTIDQDGDGYPAQSNKLYVGSQPTNGKRRNTMTQVSIVDCDDTNASILSCLRRPVTITYTGSTLTNYDVLISLDTATIITAGKMTSDCGDIQTYDSDGTTAINYWIEGGCNTSATQIWVTVPSIPDGGKTIYLTYDGSTGTNRFQSWAGTFTLLYSASCPTGWTQNSIFDSAFPLGAATSGGTGGASSHSHAQVSCTTDTNTLSGCRTGGGQPTSPSHSHTGAKADVSSAPSVLPPYLDVVMCKKADLVIPASFIAMFDTTVPSGWTRFSTLDNTFPRGATSYGGTGGATTHSHSTTGGYATGTSGVSNVCQASVIESTWCQNHTHTSGSGTSATGNNTPPYLDMIFGQKDSEGVATAGMIAITDAVPPLGWTRFSALDDKFPRGASSYGGTGGASTHSHSVTVSTGTCSSTKSGNGSGSVAGGRQSHTHSCTATSDSQSNLPPYTNAIYIKRNSPTPTTAVGSETYY